MKPSTESGINQRSAAPYSSLGLPMTEDELEILEEFVQESREHLAAIEPDLLEMERQGSGTAAEIVNRVFRAIHSTKGGAAFLAFESLKEFSHVMESVLMLIRDGKLDINSEVIDALLRGVDVLRRMVDDVRASDAVDCTTERSLLDAILAPSLEPAAKTSLPVRPAGGAASTSTAASRGDPTGASPQRDEPAPPVQDDRVELIRGLAAHGQQLYQIAVRIIGDLTPLALNCEQLESRMGGVGRVVRRLPERRGDSGAESSDTTVRWELASVLDRRLLATATGLPERCIAPIGPDTLVVPNAPPSVPEATIPGATVGRGPVTSIDAPSSYEKTSTALAKAALVAEPAKPIGSEDASKHKASLPIALKEQNNDANETLRVRVELLNRLMDSASELVLGRNQLLRALKEQADKSVGLGVILQHIDRVTTDLQEGIMQTRMQQIGSLFGRFTRVARDLGRQLGKNVELRAEGNHVELDKSIIEALVDPLTHIVRNSVDHAIEMPDERRRRRKPEIGHILLSASHESGQVKIVVEDDGRGIDREKVLRKAIEKGLISTSAAEKATERDVVNLLMTPGFSTADQISDLSGRGVGMDVVRNNVESLGGQIEIDTELGVGTSVQLRLPLTLAIIPSLIVGAAGARFAVPQSSIVELVWVRSDDTRERIQFLQGAPMLRLRERLVPLVRVDEVLVVGGFGRGEKRTVAANTDHYILLLRTGTEQYGLVVDELFESEEIVVKPLPQFLKGIECFAGTTILGDGSVTMILDPSGIANRAGLKFASANAAVAGANSATRASGVAQRSVILFAGSPEEQYIVPQEQVLRLERVARSELQRVGGKDYVCYRGAGLPLVRLEQVLPVGGVPDFAEEVFLLIPRVGRGRAIEPRAGILVWRILDAIDLELNLQPALFDGPGVRGATLLDGVLTTFIDPVALVDGAQPDRERAA